jgi:hypothetical protein
MVAALIGGGFVAGWAAAVGTAERFSSGRTIQPDIDWTSMFGTVSGPLFTAGLISALIALAVHATLWPATRREP